MCTLQELELLCRMLEELFRVDTLYQAHVQPLADSQGHVTVTALASIYNIKQKLEKVCDTVAGRVILCSYPVSFLSYS